MPTKRKLAIHFGQSNSGPFHTIDSWLSSRLDLAMINAPRRVSGSYNQLFTMPGQYPGFGTFDLKAVAVPTVRYLTWWNPVCTGYRSYPGNLRVVLPATATEFYAEQRLRPGPNAVATVTRKLTQTQHTVTVIEPMSVDVTLSVSTVNTTTNAFTITHPFLADQRVRIDAAGGVTLPGGLERDKAYFARLLGSDLQLSLTEGGAAIDITSEGSGVITILNLELGTRIEVLPALDPPPVADEEFTYELEAEGGVGGNIAVLNQHFGLLRRGDLRGLRIRCTGVPVGSPGRSANVGEVRIVSGWDDITRQLTTTEAWPHDPIAGDTFELIPQAPATEFKDYGWFLPMSIFETDLNAIVGKKNPYPPGFDYPSYWHVPQVYSTVGQEITGDNFYFTTLPRWISWHTGGMVRLAEILGEEVWVIACDFGGTSTAHNEREIGQTNVGWYDRAQQSDWSLARTNNCFARFLDELDAAIAIAAAQGVELECVGVWRVQTDADMSLGTDPTYGGIDTNPELWSHKYLESNRSFRKRVRQEIKDRGLWPGDAETLPWVQCLTHEEFTELVIGDPVRLKRVNDAVLQLTAEDPYAESFDTTGLETWDGDHYTGEAAGDEYERWQIDAWLRIRHRSDRSGEVEICNLALAHIGETAAITALDGSDQSVQAKLCARYYPIARDAMLEAKPWAFALKRLQLHEVTTAIARETSTWRFAYVLPNDCLRVLAVVPRESFDDYFEPGIDPRLDDPRHRTRVLHYPNYPPGILPVQQEFSTETLSNGTRVIYTNVEDAALRFVSRVTNTKLYSQQFRQALAFHLASMLVGPLMKGPESAAETRRLTQMAQFYVTQAGDHNAQQRIVRVKHTPPWLGSR